MTEFAKRLMEVTPHYIEKGGSHDIEHITRVMNYALKLHELYGGDLQVIQAAAFLHDIGRFDKNLHQEESRNLSASIARKLLEEIELPSNQVDRVVEAILDHDQPGLTPRSLEGRILKDADFLAGMGAEGILRAAMWTGESGGGRSDVIERLQIKMKARMEGLEFIESQLTAKYQYLLVELFLENLANEPFLVEGIDSD